VNTLNDSKFVSSVAALYDQVLVPLIFEQYASYVAEQLRRRAPSRVLEIACGTGVVTRAMSLALPKSTSIVATDLNQPMLDVAIANGTSRPVEWRPADAMSLPFDDASFDAVVCQFGAMFFPDKPKAFAEAKRVLKPGGAFVFSVWDRIEDNEFADVVTHAVARLFPNAPPRFLARTPHGYFDVAIVQRDLRDGGFASPVNVVTRAERSRASSARIPAIGYVQGTVMRSEIEAIDLARLDEATRVAEQDIADRFGHGEVDGKIQAHIVTVER
jgi:ubiquinone/menaquinone biosynthesis C-methylase UbiE